MLNLLLTNACDNRCPYCFANPVDSTNPAAEFMSNDAFETAVAFALRSGRREIRLLGGEPLLHPKFAKLYSRLDADRSIERIRIYTGGNVEGPSVEALSAVKTHITFNINDPASYEPDTLTRIMSNLDLWTSRGISTTLGYNFWRESDDGSWLIGLSQRMGIQRLRVCIANPRAGVETAAPTRTARHRMSDSVFAFLVAVVEAGLQPRLDCCWPACYFSDSQWGTLTSLSGGHLHPILRCQPALDVHPDLSVSRCFGVGSSQSVRLLDFADADDLSRHFVGEIDEFASLVDDPTCANCVHHQNSRCLGGCLSFRLASANALRKSAEAAQPHFDAAKAAANSGDVSETLNEYRAGLALFPHNVNAVCELAWSLYRDGAVDEFASTVEGFRPLLERAGTASSAVLLGLYREATGEPARARAYYLQAMRRSTPSFRGFVSELLTRTTGLAHGRVGP